MAKAKIAVVGGGIAGATISLYLAELGVDVTLFEKNSSLVSGPPMCHLHAGGNLYREISDAQCVQLLKESIDLVRYYPNAIDYRPTVIAVPTEDHGNPNDLLPRLELLVTEYQKLIATDPANKVLGDPEHYFRLFERDELETLAQKEALKEPKTMEEWMIPIAKNVDMDKLKFPLIMVQEYGINLFRLGASAALRLEALEHARLLLDTEVRDATEEQSGFTITFRHNGKEEQEHFDYLINAAGFNSGTIDDYLGYKRTRFVEFKAAYVTHWETPYTWPEVIFHGERGTPRGMGQFTPYPDGYFQLHGMTNEITLFDNGLVKSTAHSSQPKLDSLYVEKIEKSWSLDRSLERGQRAIAHLANYIPAFKEAKVASKPLYGAQQIPGDDETLRAAEVSFEGERYARCEIVKASSVLNMADAILKRLVNLGFTDSSAPGWCKPGSLQFVNDSAVSQTAQELTEVREYPRSLSKRTRTSA